MRHATSFVLPLLTALAAVPLTRPASAQATAPPAAVLVELFTSEGCSSCPPADQLLRQIDRHHSPAGQLLVGLSEHVTYWNGLGWTDPYSTAQATERQEGYGRRFALESVYTPQMVVNGRAQFVGDDVRALRAALAAEARQKHIALHVLAAVVTGRTIALHYAAADLAEGLASGLPAHAAVELFAVLADDLDTQTVPRGENSGRALVHASVARALVPLGTLQATADTGVSLPLPPSFTPDKPHHLVLFAQQSGLGAVVGVDTVPF